MHITLSENVTSENRHACTSAAYSVLDNSCCNSDNRTLQRGLRPFITTGSAFVKTGERTFFSNIREPVTQSLQQQHGRLCFFSLNSCTEKSVCQFVTACKYKSTLEHSNRIKHKRCRDTSTEGKTS